VFSVRLWNVPVSSFVDPYGWKKTVEVEFCAERIFLFISLFDTLTFFKKLFSLAGKCLCLEECILVSYAYSMRRDFMFYYIFMLTEIAFLYFLVPLITSGMVSILPQVAHK
jgi:hypothetical protein